MLSFWWNDYEGALLIELVLRADLFLLSQPRLKPVRLRTSGQQSSQILPRLFSAIVPVLLDFFFYFTHSFGNLYVDSAKNLCFSEVCA